MFSFVILHAISVAEEGQDKKNHVVINTLLLVEQLLSMADQLFSPCSRYQVAASETEFDAALLVNIAIFAVIYLIIWSCLDKELIQRDQHGVVCTISDAYWKTRLRSTDAHCTLGHIIDSQRELCAPTLLSLPNHTLFSKAVLESRKSSELLHRSKSLQDVGAGLLASQSFASLVTAVREALPAFTSSQWQCVMDVCQPL